MPYPAAIERSVSPGPTTCASSAGGSSRMAVIGACRAYRTGRGGSYSRVTSGAARCSPQATAATRVSSFAPATVATGARAATTMQVAVAAVWAHRRIAPRFPRRRRDDRTKKPTERSLDRVSGTRTWMRRARRRTPSRPRTCAPQASSVPFVPHPVGSLGPR